MANRVMQAKREKHKRQKRLFPKKYSAGYIAVGAPPNRLVMQEYKERTRSLAFDAKYMEWLETVTRFRGKPPGKKEAEEAAKRIKERRANPAAALVHIKQDAPKLWDRIADSFPMLMNVCLEDSVSRQVRMFWSSDRASFLLLEINHVGRFVRASIRYADAERCKSRFVSDQVRWVEFVSSSPPEPPAAPKHWLLRKKS